MIIQVYKQSFQSSFIKCKEAENEKKDGKTVRFNNYNYNILSKSLKQYDLGMLLNLESEKYDRVVLDTEINDKILENLSSIDKDISFYLNGVIIPETDLTYFQKNRIKNMVICLNNNILIYSSGILEIPKVDQFFKYVTIYNEKRIEINGFDFTKEVNLNGFLLFLDKFDGIKEISFKDCKTTKSIQEIIIDKIRTRFSSIEYISTNNSWSSENIVIYEQNTKSKFIIKGKQKTAIPDSIFFRSIESNIVKIDYSNLESNESIEFIANAIRVFGGIEINDCNINIKVFNVIENLIPDIIRYKFISFQDCSFSSKAKLALKKIIHDNNNDNFPYIFKLDREIFNVKNLIDNNVLYLEGDSFHIFDMLYNMSSNINFIVLSKINFNKEETLKLRGILENSNISDIIFSDCSFFDNGAENFLSIVSKFDKDKFKRKYGFFGEDLSSKKNSAIFSFFKNYATSFRLSSDSIANNKKKDRAQQTIIPKNLLKNKLFNMYGSKTTTANQKKYLEELLLLEAGYPGEVSSRLLNNVYIKPSKEEVKTKIMIILDSWIDGNAKVKNILVDRLIAYGEGSHTKPLLLVGPPGIGKTSFLQAIAAVLRYFDTGDFEGSLYNYDDASENRVDPWGYKIGANNITQIEHFTGFLPTYKDSDAGIMWRSLQKNINTEGIQFTRAICLDEVEKMKSQHTDLSKVLLEILGSTTFTDIYMNVPLELSKIFIICTANKTDDMLAWITNRVEVIELEPLTTEELKKLINRLLTIEFNKKKLSKGDYEINESDLEQFVFSIGVDNIRDIKNKFGVIARRIDEIKKSKKTVVKIDNTLFYDIFGRDVINISKFKKSPGYAACILKNDSGQFKTCYFSCVSIPREMASSSAKVEFSTSFSSHISDNHFAYFRQALQHIISCVLSSIKERISQVKFPHQISVECLDNFSLKDEISYSIPACVLSIFSNIYKKQINDVIILGSAETNGILKGTTTNILHRLQAVLTSDNAHVRRIYIPHLPEGLSFVKQKINNALEAWKKINNIKDNVTIVEIESLEELIRILFFETTT